jgi:5S rRNA maturation endonuclease (ribonuclease M5)
MPTIDSLLLLQNRAADRLDDLMETLSIEVHPISDNILAGVCPLHPSADNPSAFNIYRKSKKGYPCGMWMCHTHSCHETEGRSLINLVRAILSKKADKKISYQEAIQFLMDFLGCKRLPYVKRATNEELLRRGELNALQAINSTSAEQEVRRETSLDIFRRHLIIPSPYMLSRGFSEKILIKFDIGDDKNRRRTCVPIFDNDHKKVIGATTRSIFEKCPTCKLYHPPEMSCATASENRLNWVKWRHEGFSSAFYLFNYWNAKNKIQETGRVILVESVGNVLKLCQNKLYNTVGCFGASVSDSQEMLLGILSTFTIYTLFDNDKAGQTAAARLKEKLGRRYNIKNVKLDKIYNDIGDAPDKYIQEEIASQII